MNSTLFLTGFSVYIIFCIWFGWFVSRKKKSGEDFLLGGRALPTLLVLGTTVATMVGTGSSMGAVGFGYSNGWAGALYGIGGAIGIFLLAIVFSSIRKLNFMTMSEEYSYYVGGNKLIKNIVGILIFIASIGWLGAHILGGGLYLSWLTDIEPSTAKIMVALAFAIYAIIGGYTAVVWTDTIQAIVLFFGFILMAAFAVDYIGGIESLYKGISPDAASFLAIDKLGWIPALSLSFVIAIGVLATPSYRQRIYSSKSAKTVRVSFICSGILYLLFSIIPAIIGISANVINPNLVNSNFAFPYLAATVLPTGVALIVLIAGLSATMSSASSDAIAGVSVLLCDVFSMVTGAVPDTDKVVSYSRIALVFVIGIALIFALTSNDIIGYITKMISTVMSGLFVFGVLGRFWKRYNWQGGIASLLAASITSIVIIGNKDWSEYWGNPSIPAVFVAVAVGVTVTLITPKCMISDKEALTIINQQRAAMDPVASD